MLDRLSSTLVEVTVDTTAAASEEINYGGYSGGMVFIPAGSSVTTLTWWAAEKPGGTYLAAQDRDSDAITQTVAASESHPIPIDLYGCRAIKAVTNAAGTMAVSLKG